MAQAEALRVWRAEEQDREAAYRLVEEYNDAVEVTVRDSPEGFARDYFRSGAGFWLAAAGEKMAGCIALRALSTRPASGEIKRLYVKPEFRGSGVGEALLAALEQYAETSGYAWLYLDSKDDLKAALRFYARQGYEACERYNDNPQATVFLRRALHPGADRPKQVHG
jgi:GNAT superfamily N-acetyltransferase